jgi:hypothetical protein
VGVIARSLRVGKGVEEVGKVSEKSWAPSQEDRPGVEVKVEQIGPRRGFGSSPSDMDRKTLVNGCRRNLL